jgi:pimeloyl-ACP methyl ester carboxylesterase
VPVHFMRKPGTGSNPIPLILTHGWPWTFWHWSKVIDPPPTRRVRQRPGRSVRRDHPSLPGFGFSTPLASNPDMNGCDHGVSLPVVVDLRLARSERGVD